MVRTTTLDVKKLQSAQGEALQDTNKDVKQAKAGATAQPPVEKKKFDEKNAVRQKAHIRLHRDMIKALHNYADTEKLTYAEVVRQCMALGMKQLGISY